jgi:hypothetical protein
MPSKIHLILSYRVIGRCDCRKSPAYFRGFRDESGRPCELRGAGKD